MFLVLTLPSGFLSGWYFCASLKYAFLIRASSCPPTPGKKTFFTCHTSTLQRTRRMFQLFRSLEQSYNPKTFTFGEVERVVGLVDGHGRRFLLHLQLPRFQDVLQQLHLSTTKTREPLPPAPEHAREIEMQAIPVVLLPLFDSSNWT